MQFPSRLEGLSVTRSRSPTFGAIEPETQPLLPGSVGLRARRKDRTCLTYTSPRDDRNDGDDGDDGNDKRP